MRGAAGVIRDYAGDRHHPDVSCVAISVMGNPAHLNQIVARRQTGGDVFPNPRCQNRKSFFRLA